MKNCRGGGWRKRSAASNFVQRVQVLVYKDGLIRAGGSSFSTLEALQSCTVNTFEIGLGARY